MNLFFVVTLWVLAISFVIVVLWDLRRFYPLIHSSALVICMFLTGAFGYPTLASAGLLLFLGHIALMGGTVLDRVVSGAPVICSKRRWYGRAAAIELVALILIVPAGMMGGLTRSRIFLWRLPAYTRAVEDITANLPVSGFHMVEPTAGFWTAGDLNAIYAERDEGNRVKVEFVTWHPGGALSGVGGYLYLSDDNPKSEMERHYRTRRIRPCWYEFYSR